MKCGVWSVKTLLRLSLKKKRLSREGHGRDRLSLNYRSFIFGKLPPPACPGLCYAGKKAHMISPAMCEESFFWGGLILSCRNAYALSEAKGFWR